jgi:hypothetical protein
MNKSDKVYMLAIMMVILASADVNISGILGAIFQVLWSITCVAIAWVLIKKSEILRKFEKEEK